MERKENYPQYAFPQKMSAAEVNGFRKKLGMTQSEFADVFGVSKKTVERWEHEGCGVSGTEAILFDLLFEHPEYLAKKKIIAQQYSLRWIYRLFDKVCAVIDVDERNRIVRVNNYTDIVAYRPFGNNADPSYEEYEEFLESRCFPKSRDKIKLQLNELGIPFYDPVLIIEKTQGRMEEDSFWLELVGRF